MTTKTSKDLDAHNTSPLFESFNDEICCFVLTNNRICIGKIESHNSLGIKMRGVFALEAQTDEGKSKISFYFSPLVVGTKDMKKSPFFFPYSSILCSYEMNDELIASYSEITSEIQIVKSL